MNFKVLIIALCLAALGMYLIGDGIKTEEEKIDKESHSSREQSKTTLETYSNRNTAPKVRVTDVESATISLFEECAPSVVFISTSKVQRNYWTRNIMEIPQGTGSGFIWNDNGHIVTNFHVIEGASKITVTLSDQSTHEATLVGIEPDKDLAVLKIDAEDIKPIKIGKSSELRVGQSVYAIGNPFGLDQTLTTGIISALGREIKAKTGRTINDVIQTDAAINPGNSGGPLLDSSGRLIGVNTMIYSPSGASAGIGFSIPVDEVNATITYLLNNKKRPIMGVTLVPNQYLEEYNIEGAVILDVSNGSPAQLAELIPTRKDRSGRIQWGDIIKKVDGNNITSNDDLIDALRDYEPGDKITLTLERKGRSIEKELKLTAGRN